MIYWAKCFGEIQVDCVPSSSHRLTVSTADKRFVTVDRRGRKPCCLAIRIEIWDTWDSNFSLRIVSRILQTTNVRLVCLNCLGSVVRGFLPPMVLEFAINHHAMASPKINKVIEDRWCYCGPLIWGKNIAKAAFQWTPYSGNRFLPLNQLGVEWLRKARQSAQWSWTNFWTRTRATKLNHTSPACYEYESNNNESTVRRDAEWMCFLWQKPTSVNDAV